MPRTLTNADIREIGRKLDEMIRDPETGQPYHAETTEGGTAIGVFVKLSLMTRLFMAGGMQAKLPEDLPRDDADPPKRFSP
ncbi:hypothetical protein [Neotabrizicola sp. VNH66]|uniref:hypothetical protein n=1 Tax=Neotabrizicola sp. VNH66 TaxID=3400918 RepID=UPI003C0975B3